MWISNDGIKHLTSKEKADRFDAMQEAIKHTLKVYENRRTESLKKYNSEGVLNQIKSYEYGQAIAYESVIKDLERWIV